MLTVISCGGQDGQSEANVTEATEEYGGYEMDDFAKVMEDEYQDQDQNLISDIILEDRKLIKTAYLSFEVDDIIATSAKIHSAIDKHQAYISSEEEYNSYDRENVTIDVRIPSSNFEAFMMDVTSGVEYFESKDISATDVTEEFIDVEARIKTKKEVEQKYISLLDKAVSINEIMEIEQHIGRIREEIEAAEGRLKYLQNATSYSTITLNYFKVLQAPSKYSQEFGGSFYRGWDGFVSVLIGLVSIWPVFFLGICGYVTFRVIRKRKKSRIE